MTEAFAPPGAGAVQPGSFGPAGTQQFPQPPPPASPETWAQVSPGAGPPNFYDTPGYPPRPGPGYPPGPAWGSGAGTSGPATTPAPAARPAPQRSPIDWAGIPPQLIASLTISVGVVVLFFANLMMALGAPAGTRGNVRLLQFLSPADLAVGVFLMVAIALSVLPSDVAQTGPRPRDASTPPRSTPNLFHPSEVRLVAGVVSVSVAVAALLRAIVVLTVSNEHVVLKLGSMIDGLAAVLVASAAAMWALAPFKPK